MSPRRPLREKRHLSKKGALQQQDMGTTLYCDNCKQLGSIKALNEYGIQQEMTPEIFQIIKILV